MTTDAIKDHLNQLYSYKRQMASHQAERKGGQLMIRSIAVIEALLSQIESAQQAQHNENLLRPRRIAGNDAY